MDKKLEKALNEQIKNEFYSSYLYLSMASYFESKSLPGFAHWMKIQAKEEWSHGTKISEFFYDRGVRVILEAIAQPPSDFSSVVGIFEEVLKHEKKVTGMINALYDMSQKVNDNPTIVLLQWFINEQVEEEKNATLILDTLKIIKAETGPALVMFDRELAKREG